MTQFQSKWSSWKPNVPEAVSAKGAKSTYGTNGTDSTSVSRNILVDSQVDLYTAMSQAIADIAELYCPGLATDAEEKKLGAMPTETLLEIQAWRAAWFTLLRVRTQRWAK